jgi:Protein of unknown function (DUF3592)
MPLLILFIFILALVIALMAWNRWNQKQIEQAADWPTTEATIQQTEFREFTSNSRGEPAHSYPCFAFSYVVNGEYYSGRFGLAIEGEPADTLIREMKDRKFTVSYKPAKPSEFYIADEMMDGHEVLQKMSARGTVYPE